MPMYTLTENQAPQVSSGGFYSQQALHQGFFDGEYVTVFEIVISVNKKSCSIFIVVTHGPFQQEIGFTTYTFFSTWYLCSIMQN